MWNVDCFVLIWTKFEFHNHSNGCLSCGLCNLFVLYSLMLNVCRIGTICSQRFQVCLLDIGIVIN